MSESDQPKPGPSLIDRVQAELRSVIARWSDTVAGAIEAALEIDWGAAMRSEVRRLPSTVFVAGLAFMSIPLTIAIGAELLASRDTGKARRDSDLGQIERERHRRTADAFGGIAAPTISDTLATVARDLPVGLSLHRIAAGSDGRVTFAIDTNDPDALRLALRRVPSLREVREVDQTQSESGVRVVMAGRVRP